MAELIVGWGFKRIALAAHRGFVRVPRLRGFSSLGMNYFISENEMGPFPTPPTGGDRTLSFKQALRFCKVIIIMKVIIDLCIVPVGTGVSLSSYVAACEKVLTDAGLKTVLHANGTNIEGKWDTVFTAVRRCHEIVHDMGAPRVFTVMKVGTRTDRSQTMEEKTASVQKKLGTMNHRD